MDRLKLATIWLGGCSGCHMSFLDLDEWLIELPRHVDLVYSPIMDIKVYPDPVDVCLVEGAVANTDNWEMIHQVRARTRMLVSFGDCAVTGNVTAMRNPLGSPARVLQRAYLDTALVQPGLPESPGLLPPLLPRVYPVHEVVPVEVFLQGCPPSAARIRALLEQIIAGQVPAFDSRPDPVG